MAETSFDLARMISRLAALMSVDTTTGREDAGLPTLEGILASAGAVAIERRPAAAGRTNVLARFGGEPRVLYTTHLDTVPPYLPPTIDPDGRTVRGRGACDAKGQVVAQLAAIEALVAAGLRDVAWLGVVGEETDSVGAKAEEARAAEGPPPFPELRLVVNGEPTRNALGAGQRGILHLKLRCRGKAAHSGTPERGRNAALDLVDWIQELRRLPLAEDADLGPEVWNLGRLAAGRAVNVVPDLAEADVLLRQVPGSAFAESVRRVAPADATVEVLAETGPAVFPVIPGAPRVRLPFGSDAPRLARLARGGRVALVGPGDIELAHSVDERITVAELEEGARLNLRLGRSCFGEPAP